MNMTIVLYSLKYAMDRPNMELSIVSKYIMENLQDIPSNDLKQMMLELKGRYAKHPEDEHYILAKILYTAIKRELYGEK
jgi:hypothetical protein